MATATNPTDIAESFEKNAATYDALPGGATTAVCALLLPYLNTRQPITNDSIIHDNAAGTGLDILALKQLYPSIHPVIYATDLSPAMLSILQHRQPQFNATVHASVADSADLSIFENEKFTHSITNFGLFFVPDYRKALDEIIRTTKPGGAVGITSWEYIGFQPYIQHTMLQIRPDDTPWSPPWDAGFSDPAWVTELLEGVGLKQVEVHRHDVWNHQSDLDALAGILKGLMGGVLAGWTEEERGRWESEMKKSFKEVGGLEETDGGWKLKMKALIAVGTKAG